MIVSLCQKTWNVDDESFGLSVTREILVEFCISSVSTAMRLVFLAEEGIAKEIQVILTAKQLIGVKIKIE